MKQHSSTLITLIMAFIATLIAGGVYAYVYRTVEHSTEQTNAALEEVIREQYRKDHEKSVTELLKHTEGDRTKIATFFVPDDRVVEFIEHIEGIGPMAQAEINLGSINADDLTAAAPGTIGHINAHIDGRGSWSSVMKALKLIENLPYQVRINNLRLDASGLEEGSKTSESARASSWRIGFDVNVLSIK